MGDTGPGNVLAATARTRPSASNPDPNFESEPDMTTTPKTTKNPSRTFVLTTLWVRDRTDPDQIPYLLDAYDELTEDAHGGTPDFFQDNVDKAVADGTEHRIIPIRINFDAITRQFNTATIDGDVDPGSA